MRMRTEIQRLTKKREASRWKNRKEEPAGRCSADFFARKVCRAFCLAGCLSLLLLSGCGKDQELEQFYSEMESFTERANQNFQTLSGIDPSSENAVDELLAAMDSLAETFTVLAEISVPEEFASSEEIADEASSYMTEAVALYHEAYADGGYSENTAATAQENYDRAVMRMNVISEVLQGETPTDAAVTVTTEPASQQ